MESEKIFQVLNQAGADWADKDAAAAVLEETRKSLLASLTLRYTSAGDTTTAQAERLALSSDDYREHIRQMVEARRVAIRAKVRFESTKLLAELRRTEEATRRAEASLR